MEWSTPGPGGGAFGSRREFATLREAVLYVRTLPHGARAKDDGAVWRKELRRGRRRGTRTSDEGTMNIRRGLFRGWLVLSVCWIAIIGVVAYIDVFAGRETAASQNACADQRSEIPELGNPFECFKKPVLDEATVGPAVAKYLALAVIPPAVVLGFGLVATWVFRGFRER